MARLNLWEMTRGASEERGKPHKNGERMKSPPGGLCLPGVRRLGAPTEFFGQGGGNLVPGARTLGRGEAFAPFLEGAFA